jgi:hypothetical protein
MDWYAIAGGCAALLALSLLCVSLWRARREAARFRVLDEIARVSDDLTATLDAICDVLVPAVADFCTIEVVSDGMVERAVARVSAQGGAEVQQSLAGRIALALDNAGLFSDLERAQRERAEVGGDFYDAFPIAGGWMLVIATSPAAPCSPAPTRLSAPSSPSRFPPMPPSRSASRSPVTCLRCWSMATR